LVEAQVIQIEVGPGQNWSYIVGCPRTRKAAVVDPAWETDRIIGRAAKEGLAVEAIWITHEHHDHVEGVGEAKRRTGARVFAHEVAARRLAGRVPVDETWSDGDVARVGDVEFQVWHTPGHAPGHVSLVGPLPEGGAVFCGDVIFAYEGCGRADLDGSDPAALWESLRRLAALPDGTKVYCGHHYGVRDVTEIGYEKAHNPYLGCRDLDEFLALRCPRRKNPRR
jgi:glyoxylase-like metal-dependent hydrolase (beta-lactamase superfamily II)